jgi:hypothetical protein
VRRSPWAVFHFGWRFESDGIQRRGSPATGDSGKVQFLRLQFTDILGMAKNVEVPGGSSRRRSTVR